MEPVNGIVERFRPIVNDTSFPDPETTTPGRRLLVYAVRGAIQVVREIVRGGLLNLASALAFQSIFSTIPVMVIGLTILTQFISQREVQEIADYLSLHMLPAQAQQLAPEVRRIADAVDVSTLGIAGVLGTVLVAATLFWTLTHIVDDIWGVRQKPPLAFRALSAVVILLLLPTFAGLSVFVTETLEHLPWQLDFFLPVLVNVVGLYLAYRYVPSTTVDGRAAIVAALLIGLTVEVAKVVFSFYVTRLSVTLRGLYGAIAFIPMSFFWIWILWLVFLIGVALTYTLQNLPELWLRDAPRRPGAMGSTIGGATALLVAVEVYRSEGTRPLALARALDASPTVVRDVVDRLVDGDIATIDERGLVVASRAPADVSVSAVLDLFETSRALSEDDTSAVDELLERLTEARREAVEGLTLAELVG